MESNKFLQMLSNKSCSGENYFHEACKARSLALLRRVHKWMDQPMPSLLNERNYNGEQCTHLIAKYRSHEAMAMMYIVVKLGADINGQESLNGFTPFHLCISKRNYQLAEWLCRRPDVNLEATNYAGKTVYQFAEEQNDPLITKMLKAPKRRKSLRSAKPYCSK